MIESDPMNRSLSRRALLRRAVAIGAAAPAVAAVLAACGGSNNSATGTGSTATTSTGGASSTTTTTAGTASPSGSPVASPAGSPAGSPMASGGGSGTYTTANVQLTGAGSTFDNPLFSKAFAEFTKAHPNIRVNYQSVGSGAGIQQLTQKTVDFGATDAPMSDEQMKAANNDVIHIPITLGAVAVAYNLPGVKEGLKISGPVLADIYLGTIKKWNDSKITQLNPGISLPSTDIAVVHRSDSSGTSDIFTHYLASVSPDWNSKVGAGLAVNWPVGLGGKGSEGVAGQVKQVPGGIGYFELAYAKQNNLTSAAIPDSTGKYLLPASQGAQTCAASIGNNLPSDLRVRIAGCSGGGAYPISGFSFVVLRQHQDDATKAQALVDLLWWMIHDGQQYATDLYYGTLPSAVVTLDENKLKSVMAGGKPVPVPA